ncbi:MAG TPA: histidinol dehydrogenase [Chloroflexota bacterium]|nr:histidinol dehydrogenase [Chloroflexota bacterium]
MKLRIFEDVQAARQSLLRRVPFDEVPTSPELEEGIRRIFGEPLTPEKVVARILRDVRTRGDTALRDYAERIDGSPLEAIEVPRAELDAASQAIDPKLSHALEVAARQVREFYERQYKDSWTHRTAAGAVGQIVRPLQRVGLYAPGGRAIYPSTVIMAAVPARVAGVEEIVVCSPAGKDGKLSPLILAACKLCEVDHVYALGGAQAIAAMAYGTESVLRVDKILGPGNLFVVLAKRQVFGAVDIDQLPGPTEALVVADDSADPASVAADLLAQAEHDALASPILITPSRRLAERVNDEIELLLQRLSRREIIEASMARNGGIVLTSSTDEAIDLANEYAPEHMCLLIDDPWSKLDQVRNAGGVFVGEACAEALGDYVVGPSHIMPTGGTARFSSALNVWDFVKIISVFGLNQQGVEALAPAAITLAEAEGFTAHAEAIRMRLANPRPPLSPSAQDRERAG